MLHRLKVGAFKLQLEPDRSTDGWTAANSRHVEIVVGLLSNVGFQGVSSVSQTTGIRARCRRSKLDT